MSNLEEIEARYAAAIAEDDSPKYGDDTLHEAVGLLRASADDVPALVARVRALEAALGDAADKLEDFGHGMASEYGTGDESEAAFMAPAAAARAALAGGS